MFFPFGTVKGAGVFFPSSFSRYVFEAVKNPVPFCAC